VIAKITNAYVRTYSDTGQQTAYVEWTDPQGRSGRTEGKEGSAHMAELLARAKRDGVTIGRETW